MSIVTTDQLLKQLNWRYATKRFDRDRKIDAETWSALEDVLVLTPSSYGTQPWKFIVITDQAVKDKLVPLSWNQGQVAECSHYVVFAIRKNVDARHIDSYIKRITEVRGVTTEMLAGFRKVLIGDVVEGPRSKWVNEWATRQVYIALGNFMTSAAVLGIDTCPMEGFEPEKYDEALGLGEQGLASVVACAAGHRHAGDKYANLPKVRFLKDEVITRI